MMTKDKAHYISIIAFVGLGVIWGSNFIYMKMAANLISPLQIVFFRVLFGFLPVVIYAYLKGSLRWQHLKYVGHFFVMGMQATTIYYYGYVKRNFPAPFRGRGRSERRYPGLLFRAGCPFS